MRSFKDEMDRTWGVPVDVPTVKRLREQGLDILNIFDDGFKPMAELVRDPVLLVDTLWVICSDQAEKDGVDEESFAKGLLGDAIGRAVDALVESVADFFPNPKRREALRAALRKIRDAEEVMIGLGASQIETLNAEEVAKSVATELTGPSGKPPDTSA